MVFLSSLGCVEYRALYEGPPAEAEPDSREHVMCSLTEAHMWKQNRTRFHRKVLGSGADQVDLGRPLVSLQTTTALVHEPQ